MVFVGVAGCATPHAGLPDLAGSVASDGEVDLREAYPLDLPPTLFLLTTDGDEATAVQRAFEPREDGLVDLVERVESTGETLSRVALSRLAAGDVVIHEIVRPSEGRIMRFDPPMLFTSSGMRPGDTIGRIAQAEKVSIDRLLRANGLSRSSTIYPGQVIELPN